MKSEARYLLSLVAGFVFASLAMLAFNLLVDPLWYVSGNALGRYNFAFNERLSKINLLKSQGYQYDCLLFGDSRVSLLDARQIEGFDCFNLAFSDGTIGEFNSYARYLGSRMDGIRLVVLGLDRRNFTSAAPEGEVPDFVASNADPPGALKSYLSIDSFVFSLRTLLGDSPFPRAYDSGFTVTVLDSAPRYRPQMREPQAEMPYSLENLSYFGEFRSLFPDARVLAYVPPLSVWEIASLERAGVLDSYLTAVHGVSAVLSPLYDFAFPSSVTARCDNTYDGGHYYPATNDSIAKAIVTGVPGFGIRVDTLTVEEYLRRYHEALDLEWQSDSRAQCESGVPSPSPRIAVASPVRESGKAFVRTSGSPAFR